MRLSSPTKVVFIISVCLIILGLLAALVTIPVVTGINHWVAFAGGALLSLGCLLKGL
jgi:phosphotransferase system  glucose/maltose/N-acetylglucosamine-specific IIC component